MSTQDPSYLDVQAEVGITKHLGGYPATNELLALCHVSNAKEVLYVGAGIGVGPAYIAKKFGCKVVAADISEKMLAWTSQRAAEEGVTDKIEVRQANILHLPFETDRFEAVIVESVAAFVEDKARAIEECRKVTRPGGYVGLNEVFWLEQPTPEMVEANKRIQMGVELPLLKEWQAIWDSSGLQERTIKVYEIDLRSELRDRVEWVGRRWSMRAVGRLIRLYFTNPAARRAIRGQSKETSESYRLMGYGLFTGKK
jgi:ubiquinone/menaquinone biosynthesis C-methylase UbiE